MTSRNVTSLFLFWRPLHSRSFVLSCYFCFLVATLVFPTFTILTELFLEMVFASFYSYFLNFVEFYDLILVTSFLESPDSSFECLDSLIDFLLILHGFVILKGSFQVWCQYNFQLDYVKSLYVHCIT